MRILSDVDSAYANVDSCQSLAHAKQSIADPVENEADSTG